MLKKKTKTVVDSAWLIHGNDLSEIYQETPGHTYSVGSKFWQGCFQKFFINIKYCIIKRNSWKNFYGEKLICIKSSSPRLSRSSCQVIHFQKFSKIENIGGRVLLLIKLKVGSPEQLFCTKKNSTKVVFFETFQMFWGLLSIIDCRKKSFLV